MPMSEAKRIAASERMKAYHANKKRTKSEQPTAAEEISQVSDSVTQEIKQEADPNSVTLTKEQFESLMERVQRLEEPVPQAQPVAQPQVGAPALDTSGRPIGVTEKFSIDPLHYQDPVEEIYSMNEFRRDALKENYELSWSVTPTRYQTVFGTWYIEPRFEIVVKRRRFDEDGNERPDKIILARGSFFQDPAADLVEADLAGVDYENLSPSDFSAAMRLWRYFRFVYETIHPARITSTKPKTKLEVIGGTAYEVEEGSSIVN